MGHDDHPGDVPLRDVAVKRRRGPEHGAHVVHLRDVPLRDVAVKR